MTSLQDLEVSFLQTKKDDIVAVYNKVITQCIFEGPGILCRGAENQPPESDKVTKAFNVASAKMLKDELTEAMNKEDYLKQSTVVKAWVFLIEQYNSVNEKLRKSEKLAKLVGEPIKLDISEYIIDQVVSQLQITMGEREQIVRNSPATQVTSQMQTFCLCLSKDQITKQHYKDFENGK